MKKRVILRCLIGAPLGLALSTVITVFISLAVGTGEFYPVVPELVTACGTEINAVVVQMVCSLLYGAAWAGASMVWEREGWSILRQTVTHLLICSAATFPVAYFMYWMEHSLGGILGYFGVFLGVYLVVWLLLYAKTRRRVRQINDRVRGSQGRS